ncbi:PH domain-containing protein [Micromonospora olivasterospora]|uniref:PH (Pleckstrin Homology) domain-containing protein n=1 Tax=Micromonospora olivasterospora TaxID=1880 RepID=A0A562IBF2_MICOL|nr:PH domain-containing protein [Micromonospora olivasterospora]TWH68232.1 PH (Pleckstrin Homology) domain-containing protein [Micromonospora olivasterospora]
MGSPSGPPYDPDDPDRERRERDTEPIPRIGPEDGPGPGRDRPDDPFFSDDVGYGDGPYGEGRSGRSWVRDPESGYEPPPQITEDELAGLRVDASGLASGSRRVLPLEDEPSSLTARYLFPTERFRGEWKRHWIHLATPIAVGIAATFVLGYLSGFLAGQDVGALTTVAVLLWFAVMGWVAWRVADWWYDRFILTNKRVMVVNGIVTRKVAMMPLARVTDMKYEQSPAGRAFNYGTFVLESAGQDQALREIKNLPNPNELYLRVVEEMYEPAAVEARLTKQAEEAKADDGA